MRRTGPQNYQRNTLIACCGAHAIQDGLVALHYVLLPILAQTFGLNYAQVGLLRGLGYTATVLLEIPSGLLAEKTGERPLILFGLICAGLGYLGIAFSHTFLAIAFFFLVAGIGAGFQHSLSSSVLVHSFEGAGRRRALGHYNSAGDGGKLGFTALFSVAVGAGIGWNWTVVMMAVAAMLFALLVYKLIHSGVPLHGDSNDASSIAHGSRWGVLSTRRFSALGCVVFLDSTIQAVFLTFLAFLLIHKGGSELIATMGVVLALGGGMVGKFLCGYLAVRIGDRATFVLIQLLTIVGICALILLPLSIVVMLLPLIGLVVQGSSTVTYGAVADFVAPQRQARGYALIYSVSNGASIAGPLLFGMLADRGGLELAMWILALLALITIPFAAVLARQDLLQQTA